MIDLTFNLGPGLPGIPSLPTVPEPKITHASKSRVQVHNSAATTKIRTATRSRASPKLAGITIAVINGQATTIIIQAPALTSSSSDISELSSSPTLSSTASLTNETPPMARNPRAKTIITALTVTLVLICLGAFAIYVRRRQKNREMKRKERIPRSMHMGENGDGTIISQVDGQHRSRRWRLTTLSSSPTENLTDVRPYDLSDKFNQHVDTVTPLPSYELEFRQLGRANTSNSEEDRHLTRSRSPNKSNNTVTRSFFINRSPAGAVGGPGNLKSAKPRRYVHTQLDSIPEAGMHEVSEAELAPYPRTVAFPPGLVVPPGWHGHVRGGGRRPEPEPEPTISPNPMLGRDSEEEVSRAVNASAVVNSQTMAILAFELEQLRAHVRAMDRNEDEVVESDGSSREPPPDYSSELSEGAIGRGGG